VNKHIQKVKLGVRGFTLIEVIVSLILMGIIATIAGLGIVQITRQYVFAQQAGETAQVAQVAMARMVKELTLIRSGTSAGATSINFDTPTLTGRSISWAGVGSPILVNGQPLIQNIRSFALSYYDTYDGTNTSSYNKTATVMIGINFTVGGADGITSAFSGRILVRN
jgi:prepilin-type N-terminal cleavage/methylation domain-containing protein